MKQSFLYLLFSCTLFSAQALGSELDLLIHPSVEMKIKNDSENGYSTFYPITLDGKALNPMDPHFSFGTGKKINIKISTLKNGQVDFTELPEDITKRLVAYIDQGQSKVTSDFEKAYFDCFFFVAYLAKAQIELYSTEKAFFDYVKSSSLYTNGHKLVQDVEAELEAGDIIFMKNQKNLGFHWAMKLSKKHDIFLSKFGSWGTFATSWKSLLEEYGDGDQSHFIIKNSFVTKEREDDHLGAIKHHLTLEEFVQKWINSYNDKGTARKIWLHILKTAGHKISEEFKTLVEECLES